MRKECFKNYVSCVLEADYWAIAHDLDCALTLTHCGLGMLRTTGEAGEGSAVDSERSERTRGALENHTDDLQRLNEQIRASGTSAEEDQKLEKELERLLDKVEREAERDAKPHPVQPR